MQQLSSSPFSDAEDDGEEGDAGAFFWWESVSIRAHRFGTGASQVLESLKLHFIKRVGIVVDLTYDSRSHKMRY